MRGPTRSPCGPTGATPWSPRPGPPSVSKPVDLGSCYGSRVRCSSDGLNGATDASRRVVAFSRRQVDVIETTSQQRTYGFRARDRRGLRLGCSRPYKPRVLGDAVVSGRSAIGVDADSGAVLGSPMPADVTMPRRVEASSRHRCGGAFCGQLRFAGLGIVQHFDDGLVEDRDLGTLINASGRPQMDHAIQVFAGSTLMPARPTRRARRVGGRRVDDPALESGRRRELVDSRPKSCAARLEIREAQSLRRGGRRRHRRR